MKRIFVSYSGRLGYSVAAALRDWLGQVAQAEISMAPQALTPGKVWINELAEQLKKADRVILCLTRESALAPWIHFEAGAVFKGLSKSQVIPYVERVVEFPGRSHS